ncbi:MAG: SpoIIIAH-like family protein, partial [Clostridia bacterium]|nr:SpoIIIAH-like family protein [Clostridia bacterium]
ALAAMLGEADLDSTQKAELALEAAALAKSIETEGKIENLLKAKGFEECIVFLTSDTATVVVGTESLTDQQSAQIFDAVLAQTGFESGSVKIVTYP